MVDIQVDDGGQKEKATERLLKRKTRKKELRLRLGGGNRLNPYRSNASRLAGEIRGSPATSTRQICLKHLRQQLRLKLNGAKLARRAITLCTPACSALQSFVTHSNEASDAHPLKRDVWLRASNKLANSGMFR